MKATHLRQYITPLLFLAIIMLATLNLSHMVSAQFQGIDAVGQQSGLPGPNNFSSHGTATTGDLGVNSLEALILTIVDIIKYLIYGFAIFFAFFQGFKLVTAGKDIDSYIEPAKENAKYSVMAMVIVFLADTLIRKVFFPNSGEIFDNQGALIAQYGLEGIRQIRAIYTTMEFVAGAFAILVIVISGVGYALSAGEEDSMKKNQNRILWACAGLLLIGVAEFVVKDVLFPDIGTTLPDISKGLLLVKRFTNFISGFIATISFGLMIYAGYLYVAGATNEENLGKAKKAIMAGVVGVLLALGAFALVTTFIATDTKSAVITPVGQSPIGVPTSALPTK